MTSLYKKFGRLFLLLLLFAAFAMPLFSVQAVGFLEVCIVDSTDCDKGFQCVEALYTEAGKGKCIRDEGKGRTNEPCTEDGFWVLDQETGHCASGKCSSDGVNPGVCEQPDRNTVHMGYPCDRSVDCQIGSSGLQYLCDESGDIADGGKICKGNSTDTTAQGNITGCAHPVTRKDNSNWCTYGLVCKNDACSNDFGASKTEELQLGEETSDIRIEINRVINIFLSFLAIIGIILILYGGILWATAGGNDEQVGKARKVIIAAAIGLVIIGIAWTLVSFVINLGSSIS